MSIPILPIINEVLLNDERISLFHQDKKKSESLILVVNYQTSKMITCRKSRAKMRQTD
jgi:hypothetical protein